MPRGPTAFVAKTPPLPRGPAAFVASHHLCLVDRLPSLRRHRLCLVDRLPSWRRHCLCLVFCTAFVAKTPPLPCALHLFLPAGAATVQSGPCAQRHCKVVAAIRILQKSVPELRIGTPGFLIDRPINAPGHVRKSGAVLEREKPAFPGCKKSLPFLGVLLAFNTVLCVSWGGRIHCPRPWRDQSQQHRTAPLFFSTLNVR